MKSISRSNSFRPPYRLQPGPVAREHFFRIVKAHVESSGKRDVSHFGEHSSGDERPLSFLLQTFPDAKFVLIYRDGRDAALNRGRSSSESNCVYMAFLRWVQFYRIHRPLLQREPHRITRARYKDFVANPAQELSVVLEFLGLEYEPHMAPNCVGHETSMVEGAHRTGDLEQWSEPSGGTLRSELRPHVIACLER